MERDSLYVSMHVSISTLFLVLTHLFRNWIKRKNLFRKKSAAKIIIHLAGGVIILSFIGVFIITMFFYVLHVQDFSEIHLSHIGGYFINAAMIFTIWTSIYAAFRGFIQYRGNEIKQLKLNVELQEMEFMALKAQVNPHFVFNALNNIRSLIIENPEKARQSVTQLSNLLRVALKFEKEQLISLEEELSLVKNYLELEKNHLEERLHVDWNVETEHSDYLIPALSIQTLIENAIKHGISKKTEGGKLVVKISDKSDEIIIKITNPGSLDGNKSNRHGVGVENLNKRLRYHYNGSASFTLKQPEKDLVQAEMKLPK